MTPTTTRKRRWLIFYIPYIVLAVGLGIALHASAQAKDSATKSNHDAIVTSCQRTNELAMQVDHKIDTIIGTTGTSIDPSAVDKVQDPALRQFIQGIIANGAANRDLLEQAAGARLPTLDCQHLGKAHK